MDLLNEVSILLRFILTRIWPLETIMYETLCPVMSRLMFWLVNIHGFNGRYTSGSVDKAINLTLATSS